MICKKKIILCFESLSKDSLIPMDVSIAAKGVTQYI